MPNQAQRGSDSSMFSEYASAGAAIEAAKITPPAAVGLTGIVGSVDWEPWVLIATLIYTVLLGAHKALTIAWEIRARSERRKQP